MIPVIRDVAGDEPAAEERSAPVSPRRGVRHREPSSYRSVERIPGTSLSLGAARLVIIIIIITRLSPIPGKQFQMLYLRGGTRTRDPREQTIIDKSCTLPHGYRGNPLVAENINLSLSELLLESTEKVTIHAGSNMKFEP